MIGIPTTTTSAEVPSFIVIVSEGLDLPMETSDGEVFDLERALTDALPCVCAWDPDVPGSCGIRNVNKTS